MKSPGFGFELGEASQKTNKIVKDVSVYKATADYPTHLTWPVFQIFSATMVSLKANANPQDGYKIAGLDAMRSRDFTERFQLVFEGFFRGEQHKLKLAFDVRNPMPG